MFDLQFLNEIRSYELNVYLSHFPAGARILEIGGGTGVQAKMIAEKGFDVVSIDIAESNYSDDQIYPVQTYDGKTIPFSDNEFDVIFSSNVLEHIRHIDEFEKEMARVLKPDGFCLHAMPTGGWTFWTMCTHYLNIVEQAGRNLAAQDDQRALAAMPEGTQVKTPSRIARKAKIAPRLLAETGKLAVHTVTKNRTRMLPNRHGEFGTVLTELFSFSPRAWRRHFQRCGYEVMEMRPMGLFYTGYMFFGARWPLESRSRWCKILGSACYIYKVRPIESKA